MEAIISQKFCGPREPKHSPAYSMETLPDDEKSAISRQIPLTAWLTTVWCLILHCLLSVLITLFVLCYVNRRAFNTDSRTTSVQIVGGYMTLPLYLTQSDIVTILSSMMTIQRWTLTAWVATLCWPIAIFLMERRGLDREDLKILIKYRLIPPHMYLSLPTFAISTLLLAGLAANLASPILTGSITWAPRNRPIYGLSTDPVPLEEIGTSSQARLTSSYLGRKKTREGYVQQGIGMVGIGWGRSNDQGVAKRVSSAVETLAINSTLESATLPYFVVHSIRWIETEIDIPAYINGSGPVTAIYDSFKWSPAPVAVYHLGTTVLMPNLTSRTNWSSDPLDLTIITDTRLLAFWFGEDDTNVTQKLPSNAYAYTYTSTSSNSSRYYAFAWVTFSAGVGRCTAHQCIISSSSTIQNAVPIALEPHPLTFQALSMAPVIAISLVYHNISIPSSWKDPNSYIEAILVRSYSGAWNILNKLTSVSNINSNYRPALPSLVANVNRTRVYAWLGVQLSVTFLSILFLILQFNLSKIPLIGDTTLAAFYLDTTGLPESVRPHPSVNGALKIQEDGDRLKVKVE